MTGKEKLIKSITNMDVDELKRVIDNGCPHNFGLTDYCTSEPCKECWGKALDREYFE